MPLAVTAEEWIKASPAQVFRALTDLRELDAWLANGQTLTFEGNEREMRRGSRIVMATRLDGGQMKQTIDVSAFERGRLVEFQFIGPAGVAGLGPFATRCEVVPHGAGARLVLSLKMDGGGSLVRWMAPLFAPAVRRRLKAQLSRLKTHIEGGRAA
jgi:uncharacterized protein YndB with AHSA1/START domain